MKQPEQQACERASYKSILIPLGHFLCAFDAEIIDSY